MTTRLDEQREELFTLIASRFKPTVDALIRRSKTVGEYFSQLRENDMTKVQTTNAIEYMKVAQLAYDTVHEVMRQGEADGKGGWEERGYRDTIEHAERHIYTVRNGYSHDSKEHITHALTRCAMAYYLWLKEQHDEREADAE